MTAVRVAHVSSYRPDNANGVHRAVAALTQHLPAQGISTEVWHFTRHVTDPVEYQHGDLTVVQLPFLAFLHGTSAVWRIVRWAPPVTRAWVASARSRIDVFHFHSVFQPENLWLSRSARTYVITPHGGYSSHSLADRNRLGKVAMLQLFEARYVAGATLVHIVSENERNDVRRIAPSVPVACIPNGIDREMLAPLPFSPRGPFLYAGRIAVRQKGLDLLVASYARARRFAGPSMPDLILVGPDFRGGRAQLQHLATRLDVSDHVAFRAAGSRSQLRDYLAEASVFVHTSRWEGLPLSVLEAMASGRPVLVTNGTNLAGEVRRAGAGVAVETNVQSITQGLMDLAGSTESELRQMAGAGRDFALREYSWPTLAERFAEMYRRIA